MKSINITNTTGKRIKKAQMEIIDRNGEEYTPTQEDIINMGADAGESLKE